MVVASGVVLGGLGLGALAYLCSSETEARASMLPETAAWMPASASFIFYLDLTSVQSSPLRDDWENGRFNQDGWDDIEKFRQATGIDPWTDFYALAFSTSPGDEGASPLWGLALNGEIDPERLLSAIEQRHTLERSSHNQTPLYLFSSTAESDSDPMAFAFPGSTTLLFGSPQYVRPMLDVGAGQEPSSLDGPLATRIDELSLDETFWCVGSGDGRLSRLIARGSSEAPPIPPLRSFVIWGRLGLDVTLTARGEASDAEAAVKMANVVRGLVALGSLRESDRPEIQAVLDSITVGALDNSVEVSLAVPYETLRRLALSAEQGAF